MPTIRYDESKKCIEAKWGTPGKANTRAGYEEYCTMRAPGQLVISKVMAAAKAVLCLKSRSADSRRRNNIESLRVELYSPGAVYYTMDAMCPR